MLKGITSTICRLLFVNTTFKVGPSSRAQSFCASDLVTGWCVFTESRPSHPARCYWLWATHRCPKVDAQKHHDHHKIRKSRQRGRVSADVDTITLLVGRKWWLRGILFVWVYRKILLVIPLSVCMKHGLNTKLTSTRLKNNQCGLRETVCSHLSCKNSKSMSETTADEVSLKGPL